jgi:ABC-type bacteriocin/lantibiotic exporter with double-glycine peptidase domain
VEAYRQKSLNECGVCVLASLVEHFYNRKCKDEIMNEACINQDGLSLFDFEMLAQKYGIFAETYELD